jgi:Holliday junction resolvase RusA-like endonuclease
MRETMSTAEEVGPTRRKGRKRAISTEFELPIAPSANDLTLNLAGKGRGKAASYCRWLTDAGWALKEQHVPKVKGTVSVTFWVAIPKRSRDLDNLIKATLDLLQNNNVIENDARVCEISAKWDRTVSTGRMRIRVRQAFPPELRMSAEGRQRLSASRRGKPHAAAARALAAAREAEAGEHAPRPGMTLARGHEAIQARDALRFLARSAPLVGAPDSRPPDQTVAAQKREST